MRKLQTMQQSPVLLGTARLDGLSSKCVLLPSGSSRQRPRCQQHCFLERLPLLLQLCFLQGICLFLCVWVFYLNVPLCVSHLWLVSLETRREHGCTGTGIPDCSEPLCGCWDLNLALLQEQLLILTCSVISLPPKYLFIYLFILR